MSSQPQTPVPARLDVEAAAKYLGLSISCLNRWRLEGRGPTFLKLGARVFYDHGDLDAWINSRRRSSTSQAAA